MQQHRLTRVTELMAAMAAGQVAAAFDLAHEFQGPLRGAVRRVLSARGRDLPLGEVDEIVHDVALALFDHAAAWSPDGGAMPWVWAERRVGNVVDRHLGHFTVELDADRLDQGAGAQDHVPVAGALGEPTSLAVLLALAADDDRARALVEALEAVASPRDQELWLEMLVQEDMGDRAPATSVGPRFGLSAEAARQQKRRVGSRLGRLARTDPRFAPVAALPSVA